MLLHRVTIIFNHFCCSLAERKKEQDGQFAGLATYQCGASAMLSAVLLLMKHSKITGMAHKCLWLHLKQTFIHSILYTFNVPSLYKYMEYYRTLWYLDTHIILGRICMESQFPTTTLLQLSPQYSCTLRNELDDDGPPEYRKLERYNHIQNSNEIQCHG